MKAKEKIIIAGCRNYTNYERLYAVCSEYLPEAVMIISGGARGVDALGERYAQEYGIEMKRFPADWLTHGKMAGPIRNQEMVNHADRALIFWDGKSKGTRDLLARLKKACKPVKLVII